MQELTCLNLLALIPLDTVRPLGSLSVGWLIVDNVSESSLCLLQRCNKVKGMCFWYFMCLWWKVDERVAQGLRDDETLKEALVVDGV